MNAMWGPRDIAFDNDGNLIVTDTGNKRIIVFKPDGTPISEFGSPGLLPGQFDEPVGIDSDEGGDLFIADTWNQRVQKLDLFDDSFIPANEWEIVGWYGQKPTCLFRKECNR